MTADPAAPVPTAGPDLPQDSLSRPMSGSIGPWQLRTWQVQAIQAAQQALARAERTVVSAIMGSGKSIVIAELAAQYLASGQTVVVTTPTQALVDQLARVLDQRLPGLVGRYFQYERLLDRPVLVVCNASVPDLVQELSRPVRLWIADEVHRTEAQVLRASFQLLQPRSAIGFTATPFRSKERERLSLFDTVCYRYGLAEALSDGVIVPWRIVPFQPDLLDDSDLARSNADSLDLDLVCLRMIQAYTMDLGPGMVNASSIEDAEQFVQKLGQLGLSAQAIHSQNRYQDNQEALDKLEQRMLHCIVHVNMLAEGIDLPWLRWLCLRRPVQARVRFIQEVGRVIRAAPGKREAVFLDPHDLFGTFGWYYQEALGEWERARAESEGRTEPVRTHELVRHLIQVQPVPPVLAYCRQLILPLQAAGWLDSDRIQSQAWRRMPPTDRQVGYLRRLVAERRPWQYLPDPHPAILDVLTAAASRLSRGALSDLIGLAITLSERRAYPNPIDVEPLEDQQLELLLDPNCKPILSLQPNEPIDVAGVWRRADRSQAGLAVYHNGQVLFCQRVQCQASESWLTLQLRALLAAIETLARSQASGRFRVRSNYRPAVQLVKQFFQQGGPQPVGRHGYQDLAHQLLAVLWTKLQDCPTLQIELAYDEVNLASPYAWRALH